MSSAQIEIRIWLWRWTWRRKKQQQEHLIDMPLNCLFSFFFVLCILGLWNRKPDIWQLRIEVFGPYSK